MWYQPRPAKWSRRNLLQAKLPGVTKAGVLVDRLGVSFSESHVRQQSFLQFDEASKNGVAVVGKVWIVVSPQQANFVAIAQKPSSFV